MRSRRKRKSFNGGKCVGDYCLRGKFPYHLVCLQNRKWWRFSPGRHRRQKITWWGFSYSKLKNKYLLYRHLKALPWRSFYFFKMWQSGKTSKHVILLTGTIDFSNMATWGLPVSSDALPVWGRSSSIPLASMVQLSPLLSSREHKSCHIIPAGRVVLVCESAPQTIVLPWFRNAFHPLHTETSVSTIYNC